MAETGRERSSIKFPYGDLDDAVDVAEKVHSNYGRSCTLDQLAAAMGQTLSGAFRNKVATASTFGVIDTGRGEITLTDLGEQIVDPQTEAAAKVRAFLHVPLYEHLFENFRGRKLPGDTGLESEMVRLGVSKKVASKARQALNRSAEQAGFFAQGRDRLVQPASGTLAVVGETRHLTDDDRTGAVEARPASVRHPLVLGLWEMLPDPSSGTFTPEQQADWLEAAKVNLRLLYGAPKLKPVPPAPSSRSESSDS